LDHRTGEELLSVSGIPGIVWGIAFSRDSKAVYACGGEFHRGPGAIKGWDIETGDEFVSISHPKGFLDVDVSPDGNRLAAVVPTPPEAAVLVFDAKTGKKLAHIHLEGSRVCFSPDGGFLLVWQENKIQIVNVDTNEIVGNLSGHLGNIYEVAFSPDMTRLATSSGDKTIRIWDWEYRQELITLSAHDAAVSHVEFSPDGTQLLSADRDGTVLLW
jgi:WD40 repeat protein